MAEILVEKLAKEIAEKAMDEYEYKGKTIMQWADLLSNGEFKKVSHGRWEECYEDWRKQIAGDKCSLCGFEHYGTSIKHYRYCPNCGAKMDEKKGAI